jgi:hypothetical protein
MDAEQVAMMLHSLQQKQFDDLSETVKSIDRKVDQIINREAERTGQEKGIKRAAYVISTIVSIAIATVAAAVR